MQTIKLNIQDGLFEELKQRNYDINKTINTFLNELVTQNQETLDIKDFAYQQAKISQKVKSYQKGTLQTYSHAKANSGD